MRPMILTFLAAAILGLAAPAAAQTPYLVKDINTVPVNAGSYPDILGTFNSLAFFVADDGDSDRELWRTDGTENGTWQLGNLCPGICSSNPAPVQSTSLGFFFRANGGLWITRGDLASTFQLTPDSVQFVFLTPRPVWNDRRKLLFFVARDPRGDEVWRSDGTPAGTWRVTDVNPRFEGPRPYYLTLLGDEVFFWAYNEVHGPALWATDGTAQRARLVKSFEDVPNASGPTDIRVFGRTLIFLETVAGKGFGLWRSDGTTRGTVPLTTFGTRRSVFITSALALGSRLLFTIDVDQEPSSLWVTNGTASGTRKLGSFAQQSAYLTAVSFGSRVLFYGADAAHGRELWTTDGTPGGTRLFKDFCPGQCSGDPFVSLVYRNRLMITASTPARGRELWSTDGTAAGTRIVRDICPGACGTSIWPLGVKNGRLIFFARADGRPQEIWSTDGTSQGTTRISRFNPDASIQPGLHFGSAGSLAELPGGFLFIVFDETYGQEPWFTDGTAAGTRVLDLIEYAGSSHPQGLMALGDEVFFFAGDSRTPDLWKSDGTAEGARLVSSAFAPGGFLSGGRPRSNAAAGGKLFFGLFSGLWRTDGTQAGTLRVTPENLQAGTEIAADGNRVFFSAENPGEAKREAWVSDGTVAGTRRIIETFSPLEHLTVFHGRLYFASSGELWSSDGTPEGTGPLPTPEPLEDVGLLTVHDGSLFFVASGPQGRGLWKTDGTDAGTVAVETEGFRPDFLVSAGDKLFLFGLDFGRGQNELWVSDGTPAGTFPVGDGVPPPLYGSTTAVLDGVLYVTTYEGLWRSDGTAAGTEHIELYTEDGQSIRSSFVPFGNRLYTVAGNSLVETDGTPAGTHSVRPASPSWQIASSAQLVPAGSRLFFPAFDDDTGEELWALLAVAGSSRRGSKPAGWQGKEAGSSGHRAPG